MKEGKTMNSQENQNTSSYIEEEENEELRARYERNRRFHEWLREQKRITKEYKEKGYYQ